MPDLSALKSNAKIAGRIAVIVFIGVVGLSLLRALTSPPQPGKPHFDWIVTLRFSIAMGLVSFVAVLVWNQMTAAQAQPAVDILNEGTFSVAPGKAPMWGFVAMEYYWLVMNRTYVIFIAPEGFYGWLAHGPVAASDRAYFEPYQRMLRDERFMRNHAAIEKLSKLPGGFFFSRSEIASIADDDRKTWGMGRLPHTGNIHVRLVSGDSRKFIVLGSVNTGRITYKIASITGVQASPVA